jgi:polyhydroxyalkanoate synthase
VPQEFWEKFFNLLGRDWLDFWFMLSNPYLYTPRSSAALSYYYLQKLNDIIYGWGHLNKDMRVLFGWDTPTGYKVGIDVAATPKETIYQSPLLKLYRYKSEKPGGPPILIVYSYINGYYILDLMSGKSWVEHFVKKGFDVFITDWQPPKTRETRSVTLEYYFKEAMTAVDVVCKITGSSSIGALGYCIGGTLLNIIAALMPEKFKYLINLTTGLDTQVGEDGTGPFGAFTDLELVNLEGFLKANGGVFPGYMMNFFFDAVKPEKKAEQIYASYFHGEEQKPDPVSFWNAESSRDVPGQAHYEFLSEVYNKNSLAKGEMTVLNQKVDLKRITCPYCNIVARYDHIVPMPIGLQNSFLIGTPPEMQKVILVKGGHVRGVVNPELFPLVSKFAEFACLGL